MMIDEAINTRNLSNYYTSQNQDCESIVITKFNIDNYPVKWENLPQEGMRRDKRTLKEILKNDFSDGDCQKCKDRKDCAFLILEIWHNWTRVRVYKQHLAAIKMYERGVCDELQ